MYSIKKITSFVMLAVAFAACNNNSSTDKAEGSREKVIEAKKDLNKAEADYSADLEKFRIETQEQYNYNQKKIDSLMANIEKEKKAARDNYRQRIDSLDQRNRALKHRLDEYKGGEGSENWQSFKREFKHDMDELGHALRDFGRRNTPK